MIKKEREDLARRIRNLDNPPGLEEAAKAFEQDDRNRQQALDEHPVKQFLDIHERSGTPEDQVVCGVHTVRITLADLRSLLDMVR